MDGYCKREAQGGRSTAGFRPYWDGESPDIRGHGHLAIVTTWWVSAAASSGSAIPHERLIAHTHCGDRPAPWERPMASSRPTVPSRRGPTSMTDTAAPLRHFRCATVLCLCRTRGGTCLLPSAATCG